MAYKTCVKINGPDEVRLKKKQIVITVLNIQDKINFGEQN
jgi:hypothetical protein